MNKCPHPQCKNLIPSNMYACRGHWTSLPAPIKKKIWDGYRSDGALWRQGDQEAKEFWQANILKQKQGHHKIVSKEI